LRSFQQSQQSHEPSITSHPTSVFHCSKMPNSLLHTMQCFRSLCSADFLLSFSAIFSFRSLSLAISSCICQQRGHTIEPSGTSHPFLAMPKYLPNFSSHVTQCFCSSTTKERRYYSSAGKKYNFLFASDSFLSLCQVSLVE
jgi:hypothetical protein